MSAGAVAMPMTGGEAGVISSGGDITGELGSLLGDAFDSASSGDPGGSGDGEATEPNAGEQFLQSAENELQDTVTAPADTSKDPAAQPSADTAQSPYTLSPDGKFYQVPKGELPRLQAAQKFHEAISQHFTTPQEAQSAASQAADLRIMSNDWAGGTDQGIQQVLQHWAGFDHAGNPAVQQRYQQSFAKMASLMPDTLKQVNPQAHQQMADRFIQSTIDAAYQKAAETGNPEDFKAAQERDYGFTGQYKQDLSQVAKPQPQMSAQERQMRDFNARQDAAYKRDVTNFNNTSVEGAKFNQLGSLIDKQLDKIKDRYSPVAYEDLKAGIRNEVINAVQARNEFWLEHQQNFQQLIQDYRTTWDQGSPANGLQPRVQSYIQSFLTQAQRALPSIAQKRIAGATETATRARNGQFAASQPKTEQPAPAANGQNKRLSPDQWQAELNAAMRI